MRKILGIMFLCFVQSHPFAHGDFRSEDKGTSSLQFLSLGSGARAEGMGSAGGAVAEDANTVFWNPAGLSKPKRKSVSFMHGSYLDSVFYDFVSCLIPVNKNAGAGLGVRVISYGGIDETNEEGALIGRYYPENMALSLGGGFSRDRVSLGSTIQYVRARIRDSASTVVLDLGFLYDWRFGSFGFSAHHLLSAITFESQPEKMPVQYRFSLAFKPRDKFLLVSDLNLRRDTVPYISLGLEKKLKLNERWLLSPRAGYSFESQDISGLKGVTAGLGFTVDSVSFDYAWVPMGDLGQSHRASLTFSWGG